MGIPRCYRLTNVHDFDRCFDHGKRLKWSGGYAVATQSVTGHSRLGVVVPKKACRLAVRRNRLRRYHKECFREIHSCLSAWDVVVVCHRYADHQEVKLQWQTMLPSLCDSA